MSNNEIAKMEKQLEKAVVDCESGDSPDLLDIVESIERSNITDQVSGDCNSEELLGIICFLENSSLWKEAHAIPTEMIINAKGRAMFPNLKVSFSGIIPEQKYLILLDIVPADQKLYTYSYDEFSWKTTTFGSPAFELESHKDKEARTFYILPNFPFTGSQLMSKSFSFENLKLANADKSRSSSKCNGELSTGQIDLHPYRRYQPRIHILKWNEEILANGQIDLEAWNYRSFVFLETRFIAVTAYYSHLMTKLRLENPSLTPTSSEEFQESPFPDEDEWILIDLPEPLKVHNEENEEYLSAICCETENQNTLSNSVNSTSMPMNVLTHQVAWSK